MTGWETTLLLGMGKELASLVVRSAWERTSKALDRPLLDRSARAYVKRYRERHGRVRVLGMREDRPLETIYVAVKLLNERVRERLNLEGIEDDYRKRRQGELSYRELGLERLAGLKVANQEKYLMVLGGPGIGKSTFLRRVGLASLYSLTGKEKTFTHQCMPVFIELKAFRGKSIDIRKALIHELEICGFPDSEWTIDRLLESGNLLVLLDGLDELPTSQIGSAISEIRDFKDEYSHNRYITSCRTAAYYNSLLGFRDVQIAGFDDKQIQKFIGFWFRDRTKKAADCWRDLQQTQYASTKECNWSQQEAGLIENGSSSSPSFPSFSRFLWVGRTTTHR